MPPSKFKEASLLVLLYNIINRHLISRKLVPINHIVFNKNMKRHINKKNLILYIVSLFLFLLCGVFQGISHHLEVEYRLFLDLSVNFIFIFLIILWAINNLIRIVQKEVKAKLIIIASLLLSWLLLRFIKYFLVLNNDVLSRYIWYGYYIPQLLVPVLLFSLSSNACEKRYAKIIKILLYSLSFILICLVFTNDFHQLVFKFKDNFENYSSDYTHNFLYYVIISYMIITTTFSFIYLFINFKSSINKKNIVFPISFLIISITFGGICFVLDLQIYEIPELMIFAFVGFFESTILIGLFPTNHDYRSYIKYIGVPLLISDKYLNVKYVSEEFLIIDKNILKDSISNKITLENGTYLIKNDINGGYVFHIEDTRKITSLNKQISNINDILSNENDLIRSNNALKEEKLKVSHQLDTYAFINESLKIEVNKIQLLLEKMNVKNNNFNSNMKYILFLLCFIKRKSNLLLIKSENENINIDELYLSINETLRYIKDNNCFTSLNSSKIDTQVSDDIILLAFDLYKVIIENNFFKIKYLLVNINYEENMLKMRICTNNIRNFKHPSSIKNDNFEIFYSNYIEEGTNYIEIKIWRKL